jgi:acetyl esterase/lipase
MAKLRTFVAGLALLAAVAACGQQTTPRTAVTPAQSDELQGKRPPPFQPPPGVTVDRNIVYTSGDQMPQALDLFRPVSAAGSRPAVVFLHGGGWSAGSKNDFQRQAAYLATRGYVCISVNYRLSQQAPWPAALEDAKAAVRWLRANAATYGLDPKRIAAAGGSAGGQLAALLGTTAGVKTMEGDRGSPGFSSAVQAVVAFNPLTDFFSAQEETKSPEAVTKQVSAYLGGTMDKLPEIYMQASPIAHVGPASAPFLFLHGDSDTTLPYSQSTEMQSALQAVGVRAELYTAAGGNHGFFNFAPYYQPALERMEAFLDSALK